MSLCGNHKAGANESMTASQRAKELGCKSLVQITELTDQSKQTLINWFNNPKKRKLFEMVCKGVANETNNNHPQEPEALTAKDSNNASRS